MAGNVRVPSRGLPTPGRDVALRAVAACGALGVVAGLLGSGIADVTAEGVSPESSAQDLLDAYAHYLHRFQVGAVLSLVAFALQLVFLGALWARLRPGSERLAVVGVLGGVASAITLWLVSAGLLTAMATAASFHDADAARMLLLAGWDTARVATAPNAVMIGASALAGWRYGAVPRWMVLLSAALLLLSVVGMLPFGPAGGSALLGGLWILVTSLHLALARPPQARAGV